MTSKLFTRNFWADSLERTATTTAGAAVALLSASSFDLITADWAGVASASALAGGIALLKCVASINAGQRGTASVL